VRRLLIVFAACSEPQGAPTGSTCPPTDPPTYANFGQAFFTSYCIECHSETKTGDARNGAPVTIDFDTRSLVRMATSNIDKLAAWGPSAHNSIMPPGGHPAPMDAERTRLGQYIACEVSSP
jgi:uncharacterized membrane protein